MKKFRYRYPVIAIIILCAVSAASAGGIAWNVKSAINSGVTGGAGALYYVVAAINLSLVIIPLWFVFDAKYVIDENRVVLKVGPLRFRSDVKTVYKLLFFREKNRLFMISTNNMVTRIVISPAEYENFVAAIKERNPEVIYEIAENKEL